MSSPDARVVVKHLTQAVLMHKEAAGRLSVKEEAATVQEARKELRRERVDVLRRARS